MVDLRGFKQVQIHYSQNGFFGVQYAGIPTTYPEIVMKTWMLTPALAAAIVISGCSKNQAPAPAQKVTVAPADSQPAQDKPRALTTAKAPDAVEQAAKTAPMMTYDNVIIAERQGLDAHSKEWAVRATMINASGNPLPGGEFVVDLMRRGETEPFARHSMDLYFSPEISPGRKTAFSATVPMPTAGDLPNADGIDVRIRLVRLIAPAKVAAAWKPLDPTTAKPRVVSSVTVPASVDPGSAN